MPKGEAVAPPSDAPEVIAPEPGSPPPALAGLALSQEQFAALLEAVRPPPPYVEPELDLSNDPNVWTWDRVKRLMDAGEVQAVRFVPDQTIMIGWNCLYVWVTEGYENVVPQMHYDVYMNSRTQERQGREDVQQTLLKRVGSDGGKPFASFTTGWNGNDDKF